MLIPHGDSGTSLDKNVHWDHGLLIDYDYSFLYAQAVKKLREIALRMAKEGRNDLAALLEITEQDTQAMDDSNKILLHRTVSIIYEMSEG
jgi:hypothetical protein